MIVFDLICAEGHDFREWFSGNADFDAKRDAGEIACPTCGGTEVSKAIMAPSVKKTASAPGCADAAPSCAAGGCPMARG